MALMLDFLIYRRWKTGQVQASRLKSRHPTVSHEYASASYAPTGIRREAVVHSGSSKAIDSAVPTLPIPPCYRGRA